jgi:hypothetical protein
LYGIGASFVIGLLLVYVMHYLLSS